MGSLILPASGLVYADTPVFIYSLEKHPVYEPLLQPLWRAVQAGTLDVVSSELALMEVLVGPLKSSDVALESAYEQLFREPGIRLTPIGATILREAARLRASIPTLRTPDAIHAATAFASGIALFLTNDPGFRRVPGLPLTILDDVLGP